MTFFRYMLIFSALLISSTLFSQRNNAEAADVDFEDQKYSVAVDKYKKAYSKIKSNANAS